MLVSKKYKKLKYYISFPEGYEDGKTYPVLFYTHGAGGRGNRLSMIKKDEVYSKNPCVNDFIIVMPQCYSDTWFDVFEQLVNFCKFIYESPFTDKLRFYATGVSMGGYACYQLMMTMPELFTAAIVCCGGGMYWNGYRLSNIHIRAFHGALDKVVYPEESAKMVMSAGERAELITYNDADHDCWTKTYSNKENYEWLLSHRK